MFSAGLSLLIDQNIPSAHLICCQTVEDALLQVEAEPEIVLLDMNLDGASGVDGLPQLKVRWPNAEIIVISGEVDGHQVHRALELGAATFVSKSAPPEQLLTTIHQRLAAHHATSTSFSRLTGRQTEILRLVGKGLSNKGIAARLALSPFTVQAHVQAIFRALQVNNRTQAMLEARKRGLLG